MKTQFASITLAALLLLIPNAIPQRAADSRPDAEQADAATQSPAAQAPAAPTAAQPDRTPVLVELFTSEGCSSCPPADALLSKLQEVQPVAGAEIIALEEHVDYWNHDGWEDSYSSSEWTLRQQDYVTRFKGKTPFTPQMVVDGQREFTGNNSRDAIDAIQEASHRPKTQISITAAPGEKKDTQRVEIRVGNMSATAAQEPADLWLAVTESNLETSVKAGENAGKDVRHAAVLRSLHKIAAVPAKSSSPFVSTQQVKLKSNWKKQNLRIVVFVQERKSLHILGATSTGAAG
jgi:hypothetical protein